MIARDTSAAIFTNQTISPATGSFTCTGTDRFLLVSIVTTNVGSVSAPTYNGVAMTLIRSKVRDIPNNDRKIFLYCLTNPAAGSNTVSVAFSGGPNVWAAGFSYTGVKQTGQPYDSADNGQSEPGTLPNSLTIVDNNSWMVGLGIVTNSTPSAGAGTSFINTYSDAILMDSNAGLSPGTGTLTMTLTGGSGHAAIIVAALAPSATASNNGMMQFFLN